jgi:hypothetical protein
VTDAPWVCPACRRQFRRRGQSHECAPAISIEEYFETGPAHERPVFDAVMRHAATLGPVHIEPVSVGIFFKRVGKFAELRPMQKWVALSFSLSRPVRHRTIVRNVVQWHGRYFHVANLATPEDFDDDLAAWLTEAYLFAGE